MTEGLPPDRVRITDDDRRLAEARLRKAHEEGSLDLAEFDERTARLWQQAKTRADLVDLTADLPAPPQPVPQPVPQPAPRGDPTAMRVLTAIWLSASAANFVIWLLITVMVSSAHTPYPWWLWVLLPPGSVLGVLWAMGFGRRPR
jgi:Domain of unknown function (DUF1707)